MDLAGFAISKRLISTLSTLLILFAGYYAYTALPRFEDPEFIIREAQIVTPYPGASAEEVAEEVTEVVENALQQLKGVEEVRSISKPGLSEVTVEFTIAATPNRAALAQSFTEMRAKISDIQGILPPNALPSQVYDDYGDVYALYFAVVGKGFSLAELYAYAKELRRELVVVDGVSKVVISGVQDEVIYVESYPVRLIGLGLSPASIADLLEGQNLVSRGGSIVAGDNRLLVRPEAAAGVVYGLAASQTPLKFMAILGILSLTGMLIKNAIVLIDETDSQISQGKPRMSAVVDAAVSRFRPVLLGVVTTVLGLLPLLFDPFFKSLAVTIICGLSFATILTLIVVPTLYTILFRVKPGEVAEPAAA